MNGVDLDMEQLAPLGIKDKYKVLPEIAIKHLELHQAKCLKFGLSNQDCETCKRAKQMLAEKEPSCHAIVSAPRSSRKV